MHIFVTSIYLWWARRTMDTLLVANLNYVQNGKVSQLKGTLSYRKKTNWSVCVYYLKSVSMTMATGANLRGKYN